MTANFDSQKWQTVLNRISHQRSGQQDATISTNRMTYLGGGEIKLPTKLDAGYRVAKLTDHSYSQLMRNLNVPSDYVSRLEQRNPHLAKELINDHLQDEDKLFWRFSEDKIRGVLTQRQGDVDNLSIVKSIDKILQLGDSDFVIRSVSLDDNRFYLKILFDTEFRDQTGIVEGNYLKVGVVCRTSETNHGQISIKPFVYRWSCTNDAVVASDRAFMTSNFQLNHTQLTTGVESVVAYAKLNAKRIVNNMLEGQAKTIRSPQMTLQKIGADNGFNKTEIKRLIKAYRDEPMPTQYGIAQAFTRYAQTLDLDKRDSVEAIGGNLLESWSY
jgi:hypothetical protein